MAEPDVDDLFKDFEYKIEGKKEPKKSFDFAKKEPAKKEPEQKPEKKTWQQAERQVIEKQEARPKPRSTSTIERIGYFAVILILIGYIGIDFKFYHTENDDQIGSSKDITAKVINNTTKENKSAEIKVEKIIETPKNETVEKPEVEINKTTNETKAANETKKYSGTVTLTIDSIDYAATSNETGTISGVIFTINNDKDAVLKPVMDVFAYDEMDKLWEVTSRGKYTYEAGINPGQKHTEAISLTPKTFRNLKLKKSIRLTLNDTSAGYITAVNTEIIIS